MNTSSQHNDAVIEDSIDVIALAATLWQSRKVILKTTLVFLALGILIALLSPVKYSASTVFVPQIGSDVKAPSGLSSLASLAGVSLSPSNRGADISPLLYPNLSSNLQFKLALLKEAIPSPTNQQLDVQSYLESQNKGLNIISTLKKYTIGLPGLLFSKDEAAVSSEPVLITLTAEQQHLVEILSEKYTVSVNEKEGYVSVTVLDKNPLVAAKLVQIVTSKLQDEIIRIRLEKVQSSLDFTQGQYFQRKAEFEKIQNRLARFKDRNQNISSSLFLNELERIQAEYSIALNVVTELASQVESAKLQVNKDTPIFSIIEPVTVPAERATPKRKLIVFILVFLGVVLSTAYVLVKDPIKQIVEKIVK